MKASDLPLPVVRRAETGRRLLLSLSPSHAGDAIAWSTQARNDGRIDAYALTPTSLEDIYLALTEPTPAADPELIDD